MIKLSGWDYFKLTLLFAILTSVYFMKSTTIYGSKEAGYSMNEFEFESKAANNEVHIPDTTSPSKPSLFCNKNCAKDCKINSSNKIDIIKCFDSCACNSSTETIDKTNKRNSHPSSNVFENPSSTSFFSFSNFFYFTLILLNAILIAYIYDKNSEKIGKVYREMKKKIGQFFNKDNKEFIYYEEEEVDNEYRKLTDI